MQILKYLMEGFRINLKTFLGLAKPTMSESKYQAGFGVIILGQNIPKPS